MDAPMATSNSQIAKLAQEACSQPTLRTSDVVAWLCSAEAQRAGQFWHELGRQDEDRRFETLIRALSAQNEGAPGFMLYIAGWCERSAEQGRAFFSHVADDGDTSPRAILLG